MMDVMLKMIEKSIRSPRSESADASNTTRQHGLSGPVGHAQRVLANEYQKVTVYPNMTVDPAKSIADQIYESLKNAIVRGEIEPGQRLFEVEVAKMSIASTDAGPGGVPQARA